MERSFNRELSALDGVFRFVDEFVSANGLRDDVAFSLKLGVEELFTNFLRHNSGGGELIVISLGMADRRLVVSLKDFDVEPFDGSSAEPVNIRKPLSERKVGGLGLHLVKNMFDTLEYDYKGRTLCVTVTKDLEGKVA